MLSRKVYSSLVNLYSDRIYTYLCKHMKDKAMAEDLTQDCFLKLWNNRFILKEEIVKSWLFKTAYNTMLNYLRKNEKIDFEGDFSYQKNTSKNNLETQDLLDQIFKLLNLEEKTLILLRDNEGYSYEEISKILGITESNVKTKLFRARQKFKEEAQKLESKEKKVRHG